MTLYYSIFCVKCFATSNKCGIFAPQNEELKKQDYAIIDIISEAPVMCLVFVEADYLVAVTYNMFYDFDDVLSFSKFFVKEHFSTK